MPAGDGITFSYGDYSFDPRPLFTVNKEVLKTPANSGLATKYSMTLNGTILPTGINLDDNKGGLNTVISDAQALQTAFGKDFNLLLLQCDSGTPIISGYPKVVSIDVNNASDNYVRRADYTISLELPTLTGTRSDNVGLASGEGDLSSLGLVSLTDESSIEFLDERIGGASLAIFGETANLPTIFTITRNISAQGDSLSPIDSGEYIEPWTRAKQYVIDNLASTGDFHSYFSGLMCVDGLNIVNNFRTLSVNKTDGSVSATQTYLAYTGDYSATEDFEVSVEQSSDTPYTNVSINGTIQGLVGGDLGAGLDNCPPTGAKFDNAVAMWSGVVSGNMYSRAEKAFDIHGHLGITDNLNINPLSYTLGYNPIVGTITYSASYNDRLAFYYASAVTETISYTFNDRADLYASITVLGRAAGPLLQPLGSTGPKTQDVSIDVLVKPTVDDDPIAVPTILIEAYANIMDDPTSSLVTSNTKTWEPREGHFTWSKSWEIGTC
jgi:hypothetical protein